MLIKNRRSPATNIHTGDQVFLGNRDDGRALILFPALTAAHDGLELTLFGPGVKITFDRTHPDFKKYAPHICVETPRNMLADNTQMIGEPPQKAAATPGKKSKVVLADNTQMIGEAAVTPGKKSKVVHIATRPYKYPLSNYARYADGEEFFAAPITGKDLFAKIVKKTTINGLSTVAGIKDRIVIDEIDQKVISLLNQHPGKMLLLKKETLQVRSVIDFG
jgi:hypothetical protein